MSSSEAQAIVPYMLDKTKTYQDTGDGVVLTLDAHFDDYMSTMEGRKLPVAHRVKGTPSWESTPRLREILGVCFEKHISGSRELADYAAEGQYDFAELVGLCTDICVVFNVMSLKAAVPDASIQVDEACYAGAMPQSHHNALSAMGMCHIDIA